MLSFSKPFSLARYSPRGWVIAPDDLDQLLVDLDTSPHLPVAPRHALRQRRRMSRVEMLVAGSCGMAGSAEEEEKEETEGETLVRVMAGLVPAIHVFDFALS